MILYATTHDPCAAGSQGWNTPENMASSNCLLYITPYVFFLRSLGPRMGSPIENHEIWYDVTGMALEKRVLHQF